MDKDTTVFKSAYAQLQANLANFDADVAEESSTKSDSDE